MASAGPYANLHLDPDTKLRQHPTTQFFTGRMPFLPRNQQRQSTSWTYSQLKIKFWNCTKFRMFQTTTTNETTGACQCQWNVITVLCSDYSLFRSVERDVGFGCQVILNQLHLTSIQPLHTHRQTMWWDRLIQINSPGQTDSNLVKSAVSYKQSANNDSKVSCTPSLIGFFNKTYNTSNITAKTRLYKIVNFKHRVVTTIAKVWLDIYNQYEPSPVKVESLGSRELN